MQWYYAIGGQQQGPVEWDALVALVHNGQLKPSDLVWNLTMGNQWAKASTIPGLFQASASEPSGMTPPPVDEWVETATFKSQTHNRDLMATARAALDGQWGLGVGANLIYVLLAIAMGIIPYLGSLISLVLSGPLAVGWYLFFLAIARRQSAGVGMIFDGFKQFGTGFLAYLLMALLILAWMLPAIVLVIVSVVMGVMGIRHAVTGGGGASAMMVLFMLPLISVAMIPAVIAQYRYAMTYFVINDRPGIGPLEAIRCSTRMMKGNKLKLFCLQWRFFWWILLCCLTLGIGFLWLIPYIMTSEACFYDDLKRGQSKA